MKKGDLSIQVIVVAAIALVVLVVLVIIFTGQSGRVVEGVQSCKGQCIPVECGSPGYEDWGTQDPSGKCDPESYKCCLKIPTLG